MTIAQKILAAKSGRSSVAPGEMVDACPDLGMSHTATWRSASIRKRVEATKLEDPERLAIVLDPVSPAPSEKHAADQQVSRELARRYGIRKFYDVDVGLKHAGTRPLLPLFLIDPRSEAVPMMLRRIQGIDCRKRSFRQAMHLPYP